MSLSHLPPLVGRFFVALAAWLDRRSALRVPTLLLGLLLANGRRTVTAWFRAGGLWPDWRQAYVTVCACGRQVTDLAVSVEELVRPVLAPARLRLGIDDTPTARYGPDVEGCGVHHNPTPGPAGAKHLYGHVWVVLAALGQHPQWGTLPLPLQAQLYIRACDIPQLPPERPRPFRTKLELAVAQLQWAKPWAEQHFAERWVFVDGGYAKRPFLRPARAAGWVVVSRLRKDAQLWDVPSPHRRPGQRGPLPTYGKHRLSLAKRAGQPRGWQQVECVQYGQHLSKTIKTFLATYRPAGGLIRVVIVQEETGWLPLFSTNPEATVVEILEGAADRGSLEQLNKEVKQVWGAGQQQVRNLDSNSGCFNLNLWMYSLVEVWAWEQPESVLIDRHQSPWDREPRRPSPQDKRRALQREVLRAEIAAVLSGRPNQGEIRELTERLLELLP